MAVDHIQETDTLNGGRVKINQAIDLANNSSSKVDQFGIDLDQGIKDAKKIATDAGAEAKTIADTAGTEAKQAASVAATEAKTIATNAGIEAKAIADAAGKEANKKADQAISDSKTAVDNSNQAIGRANQNKQEFDALRNDFDDLVAESGDSNPEIVQARTDSQGVKQTTLQNRLAADFGIRLTNEDAIRLFSGPVNVPKMMDMSGKVAGNTVDNPHSVYTDYTATSLKKPNATWTEISQENYNKLVGRDDQGVSIGSSQGSVIPQQLGKFDATKAIEQLAPRIFEGMSLVDKVKYIKDNFISFSVTTRAKVSSPNNKNLKVGVFLESTDSYTTKIQGDATEFTDYTVEINDSNFIDSKGFINVLSYTDSSNGVVSASLNTDYIGVQLMVSLNPLTVLNKAGFADESDLALKADLEDVTTHIMDEANPHAVTASQTGAYTKVEVDKGFIATTNAEQGLLVQKNKSVLSTSDWNEFTDTGVYVVNGASNTTGQNCPTENTATWGYLVVLKIGSRWVEQTYYTGNKSSNANGMYRRVLQGSPLKWEEWVEILSNKRFATQQDSESGVSSNKISNPLGVKQFYDKQAIERPKFLHNTTNFCAHRGNNAEFPENSIVALRSVKRHRFIEFDVGISKDGKWVVMHDDTVDRMTNGTGRVDSLTLSQIRALRIDSGANLGMLSDAEKIVPTLDEAIQGCKSTGSVPFIEIKTNNYTDSHLQEFMNALKQAKILNGGCVVISFDKTILERLRNMSNEIELSWVMNSVTQTELNECIRLRMSADVAYNHATVTKDMVNSFHNNGLQFNVWTAPDESFESLKEKGVDVITTNSRSGDLRWSLLTLDNGFTHYAAGGFLREPFVEEVSPGVAKVSFTAINGTNTKTSRIFAFPDWALPMYTSWQMCNIRTSSGSDFATVDVYGRSLAQDKRGVVVGLGWDARTTWVNGNFTYDLY